MLRLVRFGSRLYVKKEEKCEADDRGLANDIRLKGKSVLPKGNLSKIQGEDYTLLVRCVFGVLASFLFVEVMQNANGEPYMAQQIFVTNNSARTMCISHGRHSHEHIQLR